MPARRYADTPTLYSWSVQSADPGAGACGVSSEKRRSLDGLAEALRAVGAGSGVVERCIVSDSGSCEYVYGRVIARATLDPSTGTIVWRRSFFR